MPRLSLRNWIAFALVLLSLMMLYPGLTQPMLNLTISAKLPLLGTMEFYNQTQSIVSSIDALIKSDSHLVAILILLFSVIVPVIKALCLMLALFLPPQTMRHQLHRFVLIIGKWSMADVYAVGVFMAFLAGSANANTKASLLSGFYFFVAYCVLSILGAQLMQIKRAHTN
ncbi:MAG: paraquat-inducible protein A [Marinagarivorans sp.]|nr:paraquat-inducible protein A [Marinagarivorans sp.]